MLQKLSSKQCQYSKNSLSNSVDASRLLLDTISKKIFGALTLFGRQVLEALKRFGRQVLEALKLFERQVWKDRFPLK